MRLRTILSLGATTLVLGALPTAGAHAASDCKPPAYPGTGYFTSVTATKVTCSSASKLVKAHYKCRLANGGVKGTCKKKVNGFTCKEGKRKSIPTEFDARVTCTESGGKKVVFTYQQNT